MSKHKAQIEIAFRCFDFLMSKYGSVKKYVNKLLYREAPFTLGEMVIQYQPRIICSFYVKSAQI